MSKANGDAVRAVETAALRAANAIVMVRYRTTLSKANGNTVRAVETAALRAAKPVPIRLRSKY